MIIVNNYLSWNKHIYIPDQRHKQNVPMVIKQWLFAKYIVSFIQNNPLSWLNLKVSDSVIKSNYMEKQMNTISVI